MIMPSDSGLTNMIPAIRTASRMAVVKHGHRIDVFHIVDQDMPHHTGQTCNEQCPDLNMLCPEIHGHGFKQHDDGDREEQGIDDTDDIDRTLGGTMSW